MRRRIIERAVEVARKEAGAVVPAAIKAVTHGARAAMRRFPEEYARERRRR